MGVQRGWDAGGRRGMRGDLGGERGARGLGSGTGSRSSSAERGAGGGGVRPRGDRGGVAAVTGGCRAASCRFPCRSGGGAGACASDRAVRGVRVGVRGLGGARCAGSRGGGGVVAERELTGLRRVRSDQLCRRGGPTRLPSLPEYPLPNPSPVATGEGRGGAASGWPITASPPSNRKRPSVQTTRTAPSCTHRVCVGIVSPARSARTSGTRRQPTRSSNPVTAHPSTNSARRPSPDSKSATSSGAPAAASRTMPSGRTTRTDALRVAPARPCASRMVAMASRMVNSGSGVIPATMHSSTGSGPKVTDTCTFGPCMRRRCAKTALPRATWASAGERSRIDSAAAVSPASVARIDPNVTRIVGGTSGASLAERVAGAFRLSTSSLVASA